MVDSLEEPRFMKVFNVLFMKFSAEKVITLISKCFAARLKDPRSMKSFNALFENCSVE